MSYSKEEGHDNLSVFYVDSIPVDGGGSSNTDELMSLFHLYNIQYLVLSKSRLRHHVSSLYMEDQANFKVLAEAEDVVFLEILHNQQQHRSSSYFDIVRIPGYIDGNLNTVRETVQNTLALYRVNSLLYLNPRQGSQIRKEGMLNVQVGAYFVK